MKKTAIIILLFTLQASAFVADLNSDNIVGPADLVIFCQYWLDAPVADPNCDFDKNGIVDFKDFTILADEWMGHLVLANVAPAAVNSNQTAYAYITKSITLSATDDDGPNPPAALNYYIISVPDDVNVYLQDPASGCGKITAALCPYRLRNRGNVVWLAADNAETFAFNWKANDGALDSNTATTTTVVSANLKDCLSFDGSGWVTIPDNSNLDLDPNRGIGFCFKTRTPFCGLLKKHETGKAGYEVNLISGRIVVDVYSAIEKVATIKSNYRYDNGQWHNAVFALNDVNDCLELYTGTGDLIPGSTWYMGAEILWSDDGGVPIEQGTYSNDCNLVIGKSNSANYKWEIDGIRSYTLNMRDNFRTLACVQSRETAGNTETYVPVPIVRFTCNYDGTNNTTTQIYDDKAGHLIGTFSDSNHVKYTPWNWYWADINVLRWR